MPVSTVVSVVTTGIRKERHTFLSMGISAISQPGGANSMSRGLAVNLKMESGDECAKSFQSVAEKLLAMRSQSATL